LVEACGAKTKVMGSSDIGAIKSFPLNKCLIFAKKNNSNKGAENRSSAPYTKKKNTGLGIRVSLIPTCLDFIITGSLAFLAPF
jgi:hypothetical protein